MAQQVKCKSLKLCCSAVYTEHVAVRLLLADRYQLS